MTACFECAKTIKLRIIVHTPSLLHQAFGDFPRAYHPGCYRKSEREARVELKREKGEGT